MTNAINNLTRSDIDLLVELTYARKVDLIRLAHEHPSDKFYANDLAKIRRIHGELLISLSQKP